jgi:hypothetical protein
LLNAVSSDGRRIYGYQDCRDNSIHGVDFSLCVTESKLDDAVLSILAVNPHDKAQTNPNAGKEGFPVAATTYVSITGSYSDVANMANDMIELSLPEEDYYYWGEGMQTGSVVLLGLGGPVGAAASAIITSVDEGMGAAKQNARADAQNNSRDAIQKSEFGRLGAAASSYDILQLTSYGFNYAFEAEDTSKILEPSDYLKPNVEAYRSESAAKQLNNVLEAYNSLPANQGKEALTPTTLDNSLGRNPVETLLKENPNKVNKMLAWSNEPADLVYKNNRYDDGGNLVEAAGEKVSSGDLTNSDYIMSKDEYPNYQFNPKPR